MPYLFLAALVICGGLLAVGIAFYAVVLGAPLLAAGGVFAALFHLFPVLLGRGRGRSEPRIVTPDDVVAGNAGLPQPRRKSPFGRDWAWPSYLAAQWREDLLAGWNGGRFFVTEAWRSFNRFAKQWDEPSWWWLVCVVLACWLVSLTAGAVLGAGLIAVICAVTLGIAWLGWIALVGVLSGYDRVVRRLRKADVSCPTPGCYHVMPVPTYVCDGDGCRNPHHRDLTPGLLGAVWRKCGCGQRLPTTVLRASRRLTALCQRCDTPLHDGAGSRTDIRIPVFGPISAGKTRLVYAGLVALRDQAVAHGAELDFVGTESQQVFQHATHVVSSGEETAKTPAGQPPHAIRARISKARRQALVQLFDAAGEFYIDRDDNAELEFLDHARGLVFVVDPFSVPWVRDQLGGGTASRVTAAHPASGDPEQVYDVTTQRLRDYGVSTSRNSIAVTVVKADLLSDLPWTEDLLAGQVREWLITAGLDNLVLAAERDFAEARFFVASSVTGTQPGSALSPAAPFLWLMSRGGLSLVPGNSRSVKEVA